MDIILTRSDIDCLSSYVNQYFDREVFKETCLQLISIKIYSLIKTDADLKNKYYNRVYKLSDFCDGICLEDDERILFLEEDNAQYSYIKSIKEGIRKMENVCCLYDDTYVSSSYFFYTEEEGVHSKDIVSKFLEMYGYEYRHKIEDKIRDKIFSKITDDIKNDIQCNFFIEKCVSNELNSLNNLSPEDIVEFANSFVQLEYNSIYEVILNEIQSSVSFNLRREFKSIVSKYNFEMKSLNAYEYDIYENLYEFAMTIFKKRLIEYSSKGIFLLDKLYRIGYNILCNICKYNTIINDIEKDVLDVLNKNKCNLFDVKYNHIEIESCRIRKSKSSKSTYGLNCSFDTLEAIQGMIVRYGLLFEIEPPYFKGFEIIYKNKILYKLPINISDNLKECMQNIIKLYNEQLKLAKTISNTNC